MFRAVCIPGSRLANEASVDAQAVYWITDERLKPPRKKRSTKEGNEASEGVLGVYLYTADCKQGLSVFVFARALVHIYIVQ